MRGFASQLLFSDDTPSRIGRVLMAGTISGSAGTIERRYPSYALVYVVAGGGRFRDELGCDRAVEAGDAILLFPELEHSYGPSAGTSWSEIYFSFDGPVFDLWRERGLLDPAKPVHRLEPVDDWLAQMRSFAARPRPQSSEQRELQVCHFMLLLTSMIARSGRPATWLERARALLSASLDEPGDLHAVAQEVGMSYETFRKRFRQETGAGPSAYRTARRMEAARELLMSTSMSHREIAASLGFGDEFHFSKRFKQLTGTTPRDVRRGAARGAPPR